MTESCLAYKYGAKGFGLLFEESKNEVTVLEQKRRNILGHIEAEWRLNNEALWLSKGGENTSLFHQHVNYMKNINTISKFSNAMGEEVDSFEEMAKVGITHFDKLYRVEDNDSMAEMVKIAQYFPSFDNNEDNQVPMEEVTYNKLEEVVHNLKKDKNLCHNGLSLEFFMGLLEVMEVDPLRVVEEIRSCDNILVSFNSTFIALIPKTDNP